MFGTIKVKNPISILEMEKFAKEFRNSFIEGEFLKENKIKSNFQEKADRFVLELLIPGFDKENIEVSLKEFEIIIEAKKEEESEKEKFNYTLKEFEIESFERAYSLPKNSDLENIESKYKNGILTIEVFKVKEKTKKEKKIKILD
jgi:HSP20 family protein